MKLGPPGSVRVLGIETSVIWTFHEINKLLYYGVRIDAGSEARSSITLMGMIINHLVASERLVETRRRFDWSNQVRHGVLDVQQ